MKSKAEQIDMFKVFVRRIETRLASALHGTAHLLKDPGVFRTHLTITTILPTKSSDVETYASYTSPFKIPMRKKSKGDRSSDCGDNAIDPS